MGTPLLRRQRRGVELTNVGMLMLEEARVILKQIDQTKTDVRRRARGEAGSINIGAGGGTYFHPLIPSIIREYRMRYPDMVLVPETSNSPLLVARLRAGLIDVAFIWPPISDRENLMLEPLFDKKSSSSCPADMHRVVRRQHRWRLSPRNPSFCRHAELIRAFSTSSLRLAAALGSAPSSVQKCRRSYRPSRLSQPAWVYP